jgi:O-antigen/teichoic acid export membrane protein
LPLVGLTALLALMFPSGVALMAVGKARFTLYSNLAGLVATLAWVLLARPATPWQAVLIWTGGQLLVSPYSLWVNGRALNAGPMRPLRAGVPMLLVTAAGVLATMAFDGGSPLEALLRRGSVFCLVVAACAPMVWLFQRNGRAMAAFRRGRTSPGPLPAASPSEPTRSAIP